MLASGSAEPEREDPDSHRDQGGGPSTSSRHSDRHNPETASGALNSAETLDCHLVRETVRLVMQELIDAKAAE